MQGAQEAPYDSIVDLEPTMESIASELDRITKAIKLIRSRKNWKSEDLDKLKAQRAKLSQLRYTLQQPIAFSQQEVTAFEQTVKGCQKVTSEALKLEVFTPI